MSTYAQPDGTLKGGRRSSPRSWRWSDRIVLVLAWAVGILLCAIAAGIVVYLAVQGIRYLSPTLVFSRPQTSASQAGSGGFLDPLLGTCMLALIGTAVAVPLAVCAALWIVEYGRPSWLARVVESTIEVIAGTPDIVIALFGLSVFELGVFAPLSFTSEKGGVFGQSLVIAGIMMSLLAIPPIFAASRDGLQQVPVHLREAAFALGKTRITTIRRVLLPRVRSNISTGVTLGISRIIGDTAIVLLLAGGTLRIETQGGVPVLNVLRGTTGSLTTYVYENSPAGEGGAPQKAYAAAFVLLMFVLVLNLTVERIGRRDAANSGAALTQGVV
ncbi:MAG TPA: ABC transporter permease subunit [Solirubrobacteraceae bacterium]|nr:ABC transporter permease subunit [Solirubrobacteraceae bacterium]